MNDIFYQDNQFGVMEPERWKKLAFQSEVGRMFKRRWIGETHTDARLMEQSNVQFNKPYTNLALEFTSYSIVPKHIWNPSKAPNEYTSNGPTLCRSFN
jgi:hypothetical protein